MPREELLYEMNGGVECSGYDPIQVGRRIYIQRANEVLIMESLNGMSLLSRHAMLLQPVWTAFRHRR